MRKLAVALALTALTTLPCVSFALRPATSEQVKEIQSHIDLANSLDSEIAAKKELLKVKPSARVQLESDIAALKRQQILEFNHAIHLTLRDYDLVYVDPFDRVKMPQGVLVHPGLAGKTATWIPIAAATEERTLPLKNGDTRVLPVRPEDSALTGADGVTIIKPEAFTTPGLLALTLLHERKHFDQFTTPGQGDKFTSPELEIPAYEAQLYGMTKVGLTPSELKFMKGYLVDGYDDDQGRHHEGQLPAEREKLRVQLTTKRLVAPWSSGQAVAKGGQIHSSDDLLTLKGGFDDLDATVAAEITLAKQDTLRQRATIPPRPFAAPAEEHPAEKFERLAQKACLNEPTLTQEDVDGEFPDGTLPREYFRDCDRAGDNFARTPCERIVFFRACKLSGSPIPIDADTILSFAADRRVARLIPQPYAYPPQRLQPTSPSAPSPAPSTNPDPAPDPKEDPDRPAREPSERHPHVPKPGSWNDH